MKEAIELLAQRVHPIIDSTSAQRILQAGSPCTFPEGRLVTAEGDLDVALYFIERGEVEIFGVEGDGTEIAYAVLGPGEFLGEVGFIDGLPRTRSVRARTHAALWRLTREDVQGLATETQVAFYRLLSAVLARRFREVVGSGDPIKPSLQGGPPAEVPTPVTAAIGEDRVLRDILDALRPLVEGSKEQFYELQRQTGRHRVLGGSMPSRDARVESLLNELDAALRKAARALGEERPEAVARRLASLGSYIRRELYAYLMASHLAERVYLKPKGASFDFMIREQLYKNRPSGEGWLGTLVDGWLLGTPMMDALRQRRAWMTRVLDRESTRLYLSELSGYSTIEILALGLGSGRELFDFVNGCQFSERLNLTCVDADIEALTFANTRVNIGQHQASVRFVRDSVAQLLRDDTGTYYSAKDIVYTVTLLELLQDEEVVALARSCRRLLKPGGVLFLANLADTNPQRWFARCVLEWPLLHRSADALASLVSEGFGDGDIEVQESRDRAEVRITARAGRRHAS